MGLLDPSLQDQHIEVVHDWFSIEAKYDQDLFDMNRFAEKSAIPHYVPSLNIQPRKAMSKP